MYWDEAQRYAYEISANMSKFFSEHTEYDTIEKQAEFFKEVVKALNNLVDDIEKLMMMYVPPKSESDAKKPHKLTEEEIAEVILLAKAVWGYGE
jgi:hypothetical protein